MVVSKMKPHNFQKPDLTVDTWDLKHKLDGEIVEEYKGKSPIKEEDCLMYLGFLLSKKGDNMKNIIHKRNKCIGTQKQIIHLIKPLGPYTFECALIYIKSLIRNSILYASEAMCSIKEAHYRALESIEESVLIRVFKTLKSCPRHLMYLEVGLVPARYQVHRQVLNYIQYILQQPRSSMIYRIFEAMRMNPTRGDWASFAMELIEKYDLKLNLEEICEMKPSIYKKLVQRQMQKIAFQELTEIKNSKQKEKYIKYESLQMADYLTPEADLSVTEKLELFAIRTEMNFNPYNFGNKIPCEKGCQEEQTNKHIFDCLKSENEKHEFEYENLLNGTLKQKIQTFKTFQKKNENRTQLWDSDTYL